MTLRTSRMTACAASIIAEVDPVGAANLPRMNQPPPPAGSWAPPPPPPLPPAGPPDPYLPPAGGAPPHPSPSRARGGPAFLGLLGALGAPFLLGLVTGSAVVTAG